MVLAFDQEFQALTNDLNFIPGFIFSRDVSFFDFLNRVEEIRGASSEVHPWLNLFIPKSRVHDFNERVLVNMIPGLQHTPGLFIFYPLNTKKYSFFYCFSIYILSKVMK